jgi:DNA polymerase III delta subunit
MSDLKSLKEIHAAIDHADLATPPIFLISGTDADIADGLIARIKKRLHKEIGEFETTIYSGETGDNALFQSEAFNIPLFSPYRLLIVRHAQEVLRPTVQSKESSELFRRSVETLPDRTLILMQYDGIPGKEFLKIFATRLSHYAPRDLYPNQIPMAILEAAKKKGLSLNDDAVRELRERIEPREGAIDIAMQRLRDALTEERHHKITVEEVREIIFPNAGMKSFELIDSLFEGNRANVERELVRYNPNEDNLFALMKLILNRADEIRRYSIGRGQSMNPDELIELLGLKGRPPFVQKKILERLSHEFRRFGQQRIERIYGALIELQREFRSQVPQREQMPIFQMKLFDLFFVHEKK